MFRENVFFYDIDRDRQGNYKLSYVCKNIVIYSHEAPYKEDLKEIFRVLSNHYDMVCADMKFNNSKSTELEGVSLYDIFDKYLDNQLIATTERYVDRGNERLVALDRDSVYSLTLDYVEYENDSGTVLLEGNFITNGVVHQGELHISAIQPHPEFVLNDLLINFGSYSTRKREEIAILERMLSSNFQE